MREKPRPNFNPNGWSWAFIFRSSTMPQYQLTCRPHPRPIYPAVVVVASSIAESDLPIQNTQAKNKNWMGIRM